MAARNPNPDRTLHHVPGSDNFSIGPGRKIHFDTAQYDKAENSKPKDHSVWVVSQFRSAGGYGFAVDLNSGCGNGALVSISECEFGKMPQPGDILTALSEKTAKGTKLTAIKGATLPNQEQAEQDVGVVLSYNKEKAFGMLMGGGRRLFFHIADVGPFLGERDEKDERKRLNKPSQVRYTLVEDTKNKRFRAVNVEVDFAQKVGTSNSTQAPETVTDLEKRVTNLEKGLRNVARVAVRSQKTVANVENRIQQNHREVESWFNNLMEALKKPEGLTDKSITTLKTSKNKSQNTQKYNLDSQEGDFGDEELEEEVENVIQADPGELSFGRRFINEKVKTDSKSGRSQTESQGETDSDFSGSGLSGAISTDDSSEEDDNFQQKRNDKRGRNDSNNGSTSTPQTPMSARQKKRLKRAAEASAAIGAKGVRGGILKSK